MVGLHHYFIVKFALHCRLCLFGDFLLFAESRKFNPEIFICPFSSSFFSSTKKTTNEYTFLANAICVDERSKRRMKTQFHSRFMGNWNTMLQTRYPMSAKTTTTTNKKGPIKFIAPNEQQRTHSLLFAVNYKWRYKSPVIMPAVFIHFTPRRCRLNAMTSFRPGAATRSSSWAKSNNRESEKYVFLEFHWKHSPFNGFSGVFLYLVHIIDPYDERGICLMCVTTCRISVSTNPLWAHESWFTIGNEISTTNEKRLMGQLSSVIPQFRLKVELIHFPETQNLDKQKSMATITIVEYSIKLRQKEIQAFCLLYYRWISVEHQRRRMKCRENTLEFFSRASTFRTTLWSDENV